jgi:hypothetical protein
VVENRAGSKKYGDNFIHIGPKGILGIPIAARVLYSLPRLAIQVVENRTGSQESVVFLLPDDDIGFLDDGIGK